MAITNAQQYQQLVNKPANGKRPGYRGSSYGSPSRSSSTGPAGGASSGGNYGGNKNNSSSNNSSNRDTGSNYGQFDRAVNRTRNNPTTTTSSGDGGGYVDKIQQIAEIEKKKKEARDAGFRTTGSQVYSPPTFFQSLKNKGYQSSIDRNKYLALQKTGLLKKPGFTGFTTALIDGLTGKVPDWAKDMTEEELNEMAFDIQGIKDYGKATYNYNLNPTKKGSGLELLGRTFDAQDILDSGEMTQSKYEELFPGPTLLKDDGGGGDQQQTDPCLGPNPPAYCAVNNDPADPATPSRNLGGLAPRFAGSIFDFDGMADGGRAGAMDGGRMMNQEEDDPTGGIMDLESGRQMYFLGKLVKKATRAVKKVAKSPFGKAALGAALFKFGGGFGGGSGKGLSSLLSKGGRFLLGTKGVDEDGGTMGLLGKLGLTGGFGGFKPTLKGGLALGLGVPFALDALGVGKKDDEGFDIDEYYRTGGINIDDVRMNPYKYLSARNQGSLYNFADGGRTGYQEGGDAEPVAKKTMPLLDMNGMEKDYREDGGFVPIGRMERADDVPARLSKNEFVFTADAVRNAGDGDIDKGAEVMYNMMKNLESGGEVSEESQGLDGAREMFKTSQRLEEVL